MRRILITVALAATLLVPGIKAVSALQSGSDPVVEHVVRAGETLWSIARERWPEEDPRRGVHLILELNDLRSPSVVAGQRIVLPVG